jgi:hypothetical protein
MLLNVAEGYILPVDRRLPRDGGLEEGSGMLILPSGTVRDAVSSGHRSRMLFLAAVRVCSAWPCVRGLLKAMMICEMSSLDQTWKPYSIMRARESDRLADDSILSTVRRGLIRMMSTYSTTCHVFTMRCVRPHVRRIACVHARRFARRRYLNQKRLIVHRSPNNGSHFPFSSLLCLARLHSRELVWFDEDWCDLTGVLLSLLRWISRTLFFLLMKIAYCIRERSGGGCWRKRRSAVASTPHSRDFHLKQSPQSSLRRSDLLHINIKTTTPSRT